jgi:dUTPase
MKIEFITDRETAKYFSPIPASTSMPDWYNSNIEPRDTIYSCPPVMDFINSGYMIRSTYEYDVDEKIKDFVKGREISSVNTRPQMRKHPSIYTNTAFPKTKVIQKSYARIETDFVIKTPPGYSCMIFHPHYQDITNFTVLPGIIDTDKHDYVLSVVVEAHVKNLKISPGDILAQVVPFKRDPWTSQVNLVDNISSHVLQYITGAYKKLFHAKKEFK